MAVGEPLSLCGPLLAMIAHSAVIYTDTIHNAILFMDTSTMFDITKLTTTWVDFMRSGFVEKSVEYYTYAAPRHFSWLPDDNRD